MAFQKFTLVITYIYCSVWSSIIQQFQFLEEEGQEFCHYFTKLLIMAIGQSACYFVFLFYKINKKEKFERRRSLAKGQIDKLNIIIFAIPAFLNTMPSFLNPILYCGNIIATALFSVFHSKRYLYRQNYLGLNFIINGLIQLGINYTSKFISLGYFNKDSQFIASLQVTFLSLVTYAQQKVREEIFFNKYFLNPFEAAGYEAMWIILFFLICVIIYNIVSNPIDNKLENSLDFFINMFSFNNVTLFFLILIGVCNSAILGGIGQALIKHISSLFKVVLDIIFPYFVWIYALIAKWQDYNWFMTISYILILFGTLIYTEIIVLCFCGFDKNLNYRTADRTASINQQLLKDNTSKKSNNPPKHTCRFFKFLYQNNDEPIINLSNEYTEE